MELPLVSVICLSYNHARFIEEAVESVLNQTYQNVELILVDDSSNDLTQSKIKRIAQQYTGIKTILLNQNIGNCKAFNKGLAISTGDFVIDLAADDVLLQSRIEEGLKAIQKSGKEYGVHFSDAEWINEEGGHLYLHSEKFPHNSIPQGDIYSALISKYFICPASTMAKREVFDHLNGYDERLAYEDFDFLIRSSRKCKFVYSPIALVKKRITANALSKKQFQIFSNHALTTFMVCEKILDLNRDSQEQAALKKRIFYEIRLNIRLLNVWLIVKYVLLWIRSTMKRYDSN